MSSFANLGLDHVTADHVQGTKGSDFIQKGMSGLGIRVSTRAECPILGDQSNVVLGSGQSIINNRDVARYAAGCNPLVLLELVGDNVE